MNNHKKSLSDRIYHAYLQDGSIDLFAGIAVTIIGLGWILDQFLIGSIVPALMVPVYMPFRSKFIEPRIGHVEFEEKRQGKIKRAHLVLIAIGCAVFLLGIAVYLAVRGTGGDNELLRRVVPALPAVLIGIGGLVSAMMFSFSRLAVYGVVLIVAGIAGAALRAEPGWSLLAGGLITSIAGAAILVNFMSHFPRLESEVK